MRVRNITLHRATYAEAYRTLRLLQAPLGRSLQEMERWYVAYAVDVTESYDEAARMLGVTMKTLLMKRKRYGMDVVEYRKRPIEA